MILALISSIRPSLVLISAWALLGTPSGIIRSHTRLLIGGGRGRMEKVSVHSVFNVVLGIMLPFYRCLSGRVRFERVELRV